VPNDVDICCALTQTIIITCVNLKMRLDGR